MNDRQRDVALFRYSLIREAADPALTKRERGELVREVAGRDHAGPGGRRVGWPATPWIVGFARIGLAGSKRWRRTPATVSRSPRLLSSRWPNA